MLKQRGNKVQKLIKAAMAICIGAGCIQYTFSNAQEAQAAGTKADMMLWDTAKENLNPAAYISNQEWAGNKVYFGDKNASGEPMLWDILNTKDTMFTSQEGMLMFYTGDFGETKFNPNTNQVNDYMGSTLAGVIDGAMINSLTTEEKAATLDSGKTNDQYRVPGAVWDYVDNFSGKKWFAPTGKMMSTERYGYPNIVSDNQSRTYNSDWYWLSSATASSTTDAGFVFHDGYLRIFSVHNDLQARVSSVVNSESILFVSKAEGGKTETMTPVSDSGNSEWKLTLKDNSQEVIVTNVERMSLTEASFDYTTTGNGDSVSAIITDESGENILYYETLADTISNKTGTATVTIPADFVANKYKLKVFSETKNGDKKTDLAGKLNEISVPLVVKGTYEFKTADGQDTKEVIEFNIGDAFKAYEAPKTYQDTNGQTYRFVEWTMDPSNAIVDGKVEKQFNATAKYVKTYKVTFETWDGKAWETSPWKEGFYVDDGAGLRDEQIPVAPIREGYTFDHWDQDITRIIENTVVKPMYSKNTTPTPIPTPDSDSDSALTQNTTKNSPKTGLEASGQGIMGVMSLAMIAFMVVAYKKKKIKKY